MILKPKASLAKSNPSVEPNLPRMSLLQAAASIYAVYHKTSSKQGQRPRGVAIHRLNLRGKLIFTSRPVLLPEERFFPIEQIENLQTAAQDDWQ